MSEWKPFALLFIMKKNILILIAILLLMSCKDDLESFEKITLDSFNIYIDNRFNSYVFDDLSKELIFTVNRFYENFSVCPELNDSVDVVVSYPDWDEIANNSSVKKLIEKKIISSNRKGKLYKDIYKLISMNESNTRGLYFSSINTIFIKIETKYDSPKDILNILIGEYNHVLLDGKMKLFSPRDSIYFRLFLDEGITNLFVDYLFSTSQVISPEGMSSYSQSFKSLKDEGSINFDKSRINSIALNNQFLLKLEDGLLAMDFQIFLIDRYGFDKYLNFVQYLYHEEYGSLDQIFTDCYSQSFNSIFDDWFY